ncbi:Isochorismatase hydrolase [Rickenella mellea]|uniref:Isochorismatase hydrolase n=1 Tax=Rickenella mellea TaxID=50990 RepID=A0A4Y7QFB5_9AGAM|nr:Isochorismatase hydrolase [Rickenella mellea]
MDSRTDERNLADHARKVLLLLDVQVTMFANPPDGVPNASTVRRNIEKILEHARTSPTPPIIIHVRNDGDIGDPDQAGTPGWQLALPTLPNEHIVDKRKNNAFAGTNLGTLIPSTADLVVVGMQSDFCIRATCSAALHRGNNVLLVEGAHATYDRPEDFTGGGPALITPAATVEKEIESELEEAGVVLVGMEDLPHLFADS